MNWVAAASTGAGLGIVYYGGLWLTLRAVLSNSLGTGWLTISRAARLGVVGIGFYGLAQEGVALACAALAGLLLARWYLIRRLGGIPP